MTSKSTRVSVIRRFASLAALIIVALAVSIGHFGSQKPRAAQSHQTDPVATQAAKARELLDRLPLSFEPNRGQADTSVKYVAHGPGYTVSLTDQQALVRLKNGAEFGMQFGKNKPTATEPMARQKSVTNYYLGARSTWLEQVPNYSQVKYRETYPGIDTVFQGDESQLRYDYVVKPGADPSVIQMTVNGTEEGKVDANGDLALGNTIVQRKPYIYQMYAGTAKQVSGGYVLQANNKVGFQLGQYDRDRELIIDPTLFLGTFLGGTGLDNIRGIQYDALNLFIVGDTD